MYAKPLFKLSNYYSKCIRCDKHISKTELTYKPRYNKLGLPTIGYYICSDKCKCDIVVTNNPNYIVKQQL